MKRSRILLLVFLFAIPLICLWRYWAVPEPDLKSRSVEAGKVLRRDLYGDPLPSGALARLGTTYLKTDFQKIAFRDDGQEFYSWDRSGLLRVHDSASGKILRSFLLPDPPNSDVQFSADGRFLTLGVNLGQGSERAKALRVWETATGKLHYRTKAPAGGAFDAWAASLHDGRTLFTCNQEQGDVLVWDLQRGTNRLLCQTNSAVMELAASPDGKSLFLRGVNQIQCLNIADGTERWQLKGESRGILLSPGGQTLLVVQSNFELAYLDPATGNPFFWPKPPSRYDGWPQWGAEGRTLLVQDRKEKVIREWDTEAGKERHRIPRIAWTFAMAPDGKSLVGCDDQGLQRWNLQTEEPLFPNTDDRGHTAAVDVLACSPDGKVLVSSGRDKTLRYWDLPTSRLMKTVPNMECAYLAFTPDGSRLIAVADDNTLCVRDPVTGRILENRHLESPAGHYQSPLCFASQDKERIVLNASLTALSVRAWGIGPGGKTAAWDTRTGKRLWQASFEGTQGLTGLSPDGRVGVGWDMTLRETDSGQVVGQLAKAGRGGRFANHLTIFSPDGSLIATHASHSDKSDNWEDSGIEVWEQASCRLLRSFPVTGSYLQFAFSGNGGLLAAHRGDELWIWEVASGKELLHQQSGEGATWSGIGLIFTPNARSLVMATEDGSILVWEVPQPRP